MSFFSSNFFLYINIFFLGAVVDKQSHPIWYLDDSIFLGQAGFGFETGCQKYFQEYSHSPVNGALN
jgi:hypothetical protein